MTVGRPEYVTRRIRVESWKLMLTVDRLRTCIILFGVMSNLSSVDIDIMNDYSLRRGLAHIINSKSGNRGSGQRRQSGTLGSVALCTLVFMEIFNYRCDIQPVLY